MQIAVMLFVLLFSIILHECAHGYVAYLKGDRTALDSGRLTLNPIPHIDPIGSVLVPLTMVLLNMGIVFGWAKPVPVNPYRMRKPKKDMMWVGAAGPATNFCLGAVCALILRVSAATGAQPPYAFTYVLVSACLINFLLAVFNAIPIPPLDGSRILMGLLPARQARSLARIEPYGMIIIFGLIYLGAFRWILMPLMHFLLVFFLGGKVPL